MKHKSLQFFGNLSIFIVLPLVPLLIFWFIPLAVSFWLSTTDWDYISPVIESVGIGNYQTIMNSSVFHEVLKNTAVFTLWTVIPTIILGFLAAILIQQIEKGRSLLKTLIFSPWFTPTVAISIVWSWIFQPDIGVLNQVLGWFNLPQPTWLQSSDYAMWAIIIVTVWKGIGWCMLFYCDAIERIPKDIIEVCQLEGTGPWQMIKTVYLPYTSPTSLFLIVTTIISSLQAYDQIQVMTQGGPSGSTRTLLYYYYQLAFEQFDMGMATALATIILVITGLISLLQFGLSKYWVHYQ
ncbi:sugar ABC transporter permease [Marinilactibacillus sp. XAAS-LB27]|uniref:carbohydrate ABC transporter permease n=1 Tax=Marinilactibacillus sp. XAAS-LB27 TaxID=3114538 RepID=UPI002E1914CA|nr:sugar ABC transporter permease [Marinilactibacillus sp. XAAS-LB27]